MEVVYWKIDDLIFADYNPRQITEKEFNELKESVIRLGFQEPVIVNTKEDRKGIIISGHQRTRVLQSIGEKQVPCVEVCLDLEKEKELNMRMNKNTGTFDWDVLANNYDSKWLMDVGFEDWQVGLDEGFDTGDLPDEAKEEKQKLKSLSFKFDEVTFDLVEAKLKSLNENKEEALLQLLEIEKNRD